MAPPTPGVGDSAPGPEDSSADSAEQPTVDDQRPGEQDCPVDWDDLPRPVRLRLAELAAAALGGVRQGDVPVQLRPVVRFAPAKRAKLGQTPLVSALRDSPVFRTAVVDWWESHRSAAIDLDDPDPVAVAAAALLLDASRARHYVELVALRGEHGQLRAERDTAVARCDKLAADATRLRNDLADARSAADQVGDENSAEADRMRKRLREQGVHLKAAKDDAAQARAELARLREQTDSEIAEITEQRDRERAKLDEERARAERAVAETEVARQSAREARQGDEVRLSLLMDTLEGALGGLRRELSAGGRGPRPADVLRGVRSTTNTPGHVTDPAMLDRLLALPAVHLIVDGYNVTKTGYPELPLADQRDRLGHQLAALAARTGAEVTVVFDGADVLSVPAAGPRGVRVVFSEPGVQADDVIRSLVNAEPHGRQLVVATSDRAVVDSVRQQGAYAVASVILLSRINRV